MHFYGKCCWYLLEKWIKWAENSTRLAHPGRKKTQIVNVEIKKEYLFPKNWTKLQRFIDSKKNQSQMVSALISPWFSSLSAFEINK